MQAGGQRFDPAQLHQELIRCFQIAAISTGDADLETGRVTLAGFLLRLRAGRPRKDETVWMFDNEIDWVIAHRA